MADLGELKAKITAEVDDFIKGMNEAGGAATQANQNISSSSKQGAQGLSNLERAVSSAASALKAMVAVRAAKWLMDKAHAALQAADEQAKLARRLGLTNEQLATMELAARFAGTSVGSLSNTARQLATRLNDAVENGGKAAETFEQLGIDAERLLDLDMEGQLRELGRALQNVEGHTQRVAIATQIFGRQGQEMLAFLENAEVNFRRARDEVDRFGGALDEIDTAVIEAANDNITSIGAAFSAMSKQFVATIAPAVERASAAILTLVGRLAESNRQFHEFTRAASRLGTGQEQQEDRLIVLIGQRERITQTLNAARRQMDGETISMAERQLSAIEEQIQAERRRQAELSRSQALQAQGDAANAERAAQAAREAAEEEARLQARAEIAAYRQGRLNDAFAQTRQGQIEATRANIDFFKTFEPQGPRATAILEMLNEQLERLTENTEEGGRDWDGELTGLRNFVATERELLQQRYDSNLQLLTDALTNQQITVEEYQLILERLQEQHLARLQRGQQQAAEAVTGFATWAWHQQTATVLGELASMTQGLNRESRTQFEIMKAGAIAQAAVNTYQGVTRTLAAYPGPVGIALAAGHFAAGVAQVANIASQQFGQGVRGGSPSESTPTPETGGGGSQGSIFINLQGGDMFSGSQVRDLMDRIAEAQRDGYRVVV